jgi:Xaa-Pro dipeptidase
VCRHYHAAMMQSLLIGGVLDQQQQMFDAVQETLARMIDSPEPGSPIGRVDEAHRKGLDHFGYGRNRYAACGYSQGTTFAPNWMDWPMLYPGNTIEAESDMVVFIHCVVVDSDTGIGMGVGAYTPRNGRG